jgi:hypothetical protein
MESKPDKQKPQPVVYHHPAHSGDPNRWFCNCEGGDGMVLNPGSLLRCPTCGAERP